MPAIQANASNRQIALGAVCLLLSACGGGSGSNSGAIPAAVQATPASDQTSEPGIVVNPASTPTNVANGTGGDGVSASANGSANVQLPTISPISTAPISETQSPTIPPTVDSSGGLGPRVQVIVEYVLTPNDTARIAAQHRVRAPRAVLSARTVEYISPNTTTLNIAVTPFGGATSSTSGSCTTGTCTVTFSASPGAVNLAFTLTDGTNVLSRFSSTQIVQPSAINTLQFSANPVVDHVAIALSAPTTYTDPSNATVYPAVTAGTPYSVPVVVNAYDKDNNIIGGTSPYVDANGSPLALILSVSNAQAGGRGNVSLQGATRITAPGQAVTTVRYDGNWLYQATITASSTRAIAGSVGSATLATVPATIVYGCGCTNPSGIVPGPDGNLWFTIAGSNQIGRSTAGGVINLFSSGITAASQPHFITAGPDGAMWFTEFASNKIGRITQSGSVTEYSIPSANRPAKIFTGPDGNLWFAQCSDPAFPCASIGKISPANGAVTVYTSGLTSNSGSSGITTGPDGNLWFTEVANGNIGRITPNGAITEFSTGGSGLSVADGILTGADGNIWFTDNGASKIGRSSPTGTIVEYALSPGAGPRDLIIGPDGNFWASETNTGQLARITPTGVVSEYAVGTSPVGITLGPDGNIWFADYNANAIKKFIL